MSMHVDLVAGDGASKVVIICKDKDTKAVINLTDTTVSLKYKLNDGDLVTRAMTITNAGGGIAEYLFQAAELVAGVLKGECEITDSSSRLLTQTEPFSLLIRAKL